MNKEFSDKALEVSVMLEKCYAILEAFRASAYLDSAKLREIEIAQIMMRHNTNASLFAAGEDYLQTAMRLVDEMVKEA